MAEVGAAVGPDLSMMAGMATIHSMVATIRMTMTNTPRRTKDANERDHGASTRRDATTKPATPPINNSNSGFVVRAAAAARAIAHSHQATGCSERGFALTRRRSVFVARSQAVVQPPPPPGDRSRDQHGRGPLPEPTQPLVRVEG